MKAVLGITVSLAALVLCQCTQAPKAKLPPQQQFDVNVAMTPDAIAKLQGLGDNAVVDVYYYGFPKPDAKPEVDQIGRVRLGNDLFEMNKVTTTKVHITPTDLDPDLTNQVIVPYAQITVYSRTAQNSADEVVECNSYHGTFAMAAQATVTITCDIQRTPA